MYLYNGKRINIDAEFTSADGITFPNLKSKEVRQSFGIVEVPDPIYPNPDLYSWTENIDGTINIKEHSLERKEEIRLQRAKAVRDEKVASLKVTTSNGHTFDADKASQIMMGTYYSVLEGGEVIPWVLADNSTVNITKQELGEALRLSGQALAPIWIKPYQ